MSQDLLANYIRYREDPWAFATECVYTKDQVDKKEPIKRFPDKDYLKLYFRLRQAYPLLALPKTRRMTMSWATIAFEVWDVIFHKGRFAAFVSKKEEDANELVERAKFIIENLDPTRFPKELRPKMQTKFCVLNFPELDSKIQGFPQGADQLRQFTFSSIFGDECAFWEQAKEFYAASFPTIDGGGRMTLVSSPAPGFFKKLCFDALDVAGDIETSEYANEDIRHPMQGIRYWKNPKNRFAILELHYTADPGKRHPEYKETIKNSMPLQEYLREYELHWDTFEGQPVFPEFNKQFHAIAHNQDKPEPEPGLPLVIGFDFGLTPACLVGQYQGEQLFIFKEYVEVNMGAKRFIAQVVRDLKFRYAAWNNLTTHFKCFIDPSGINRVETDENSCALILAEFGFVPEPGPIAWETRRHNVVHFLQQMTPEGPALQIYAPDCPMLVKGFEGGYRFSDKAVELEPNKLRPIKDQYSHPHDVLQYICSGVRHLNETLKHSIPKPSYSFTEARNAR